MHPPLEPEDFILRISAWTDVLFGTVPRERLKDAYDRAKADHRSTFPINAYEVKIAWLNIAEEEEKAAKKFLAQAKKDDPIGFCADASRHVNDRGEVLILSMFTDEDELVPCLKCREADFTKWHTNQVALYGEIEPLTKLQTIHSENLLKSSTDAVDLLLKLKKQVSAEMVSAIGTSRYDELHGGWKMFAGAIAHAEKVKAEYAEKWEEKI